MGFLPDVRKIFTFLQQKHYRQTLFFSATMPPIVLDLVPIPCSHHLIPFRLVLVFLTMLSINRFVPSRIKLSRLASIERPPPLKYLHLISFVLFLSLGVPSFSFLDVIPSSLSTRSIGSLRSFCTRSLSLQWPLMIIHV